MGFRRPSIKDFPYKEYKWLTRHMGKSDYYINGLRYEDKDLDVCANNASERDASRQASPVSE